jgi:hypothetical protein
MHLIYKLVIFGQTISYDLVNKVLQAVYYSNFIAEIVMATLT